MLEFTVDEGLHSLVAKIPIANEAGANRAKRVSTFDPKHGPCVGVSKVVEAVIIGHAVARDVVARIVYVNGFSRLANHNGDFAFKVQPFTV